MAATTVALPQSEMPLAHQLRGRVGMWCLIAAESAIFSIFVVAYLYYAGKSLNGPTPREVLHVPIFNSICLFASSFTIVMAERAIERGKSRLFSIWWLFTIVLGAIFIFGTAHEWYRLIYDEGLTISSSLFGTTFYSLVGLHGFHVIVGLTGLSIIMIFAAFGLVKQEHASRIAVFAMYWHFVDAVWVVVLTVVYFVAI
jgi:cytochrome c oxidase subunit III